jgi:hypothetical protein
MPEDRLRAWRGSASLGQGGRAKLRLAGPGLVQRVALQVQSLGHAAQLAQAVHVQAGNERL